LIVIATPAGSVCGTLDTLRGGVRPGTVVTDVASTKAAICAHARATWPAPRRFVGSHPMAGSERFGPENGDASLYDGAVCLVEEARDLDPNAYAAVVHLWESVGARVVPVAPDRHDALLACTSHLPHAAAAALAVLAADTGATSDHVGNGFRDVTRIAASRPEVWRDICLTNREALLKAVDDLEASLSAFRRALEQRDGAALEDFFQRGQHARARVLGS
jgi:prephenate dehydrogenase